MIAMSGAFLMFAPGHGAESWAQNGPISMISEALENRPFLVQMGITQTLERGRVGTARIEDKDGLKAFYEANNFEPIWVEIRKKRTYRSESMLEVFKNSWTHGLNPRHYHVVEISRLLDADLKDETLFQLEMLTSDAAVRYVRDLSAMRVDKGMVSRTIRKLQSFPVTEDILDYLSKKSSPKQAVNAFEPRGNLYAMLQAELIELVHGDLKPYEPYLPIRISGALRPGDRHKAVRAIRKRLDTPSYDEVGSTLYDDDLAQAVMKFQQKNGLEADGVIGKQTLRTMNMDRQTKIERVIVNLERLRWIARERPDRYILVNIPSATLWAIEDGRSQFEMPVILGRKKRATNSFISEITGIRFNPNWTIPPTIKKEDFWPNLIEDPYYATNRGIEFVQGYGTNAQTLDPGMIDWVSIEWEDFKNIRMVQNPGKGNPLGQVRVLMPNPYNIYLHDTNKPQYFQKDDRYLSSGCVRVHDPIKLSHFIMDGRDGWGNQVLDTILESHELKELYVEEKLPVFILYQTVWLGEDSKIVYGHDIYSEDRRLVKHMKNKGLYYIPEFKKESELAQN